MNKYNVMAGIALGIAGFALNILKLELFFNIDLLFGSIVTMFAVMRYGLAAGTIAALVASICTWYHWHHPWAIIIFTAEALLAGITAKKSRWGLVAGDVFYWGSVGLFLGWLFNHQIMGFPLHSTLMIALKQGINGVFNTVVAMGFNIVFTYRNRRKEELPSIFQISFVLLALFVLVPAMGYLYFDINKTFDQRTKDYCATTARICDVSEHIVTLWLDNNLDAAKAVVGAEQIRHPKTPPVGKHALPTGDASMIHLLQDIVGTHAMTITVVDENRRVIGSTKNSLKPLNRYTLPPNGSIVPVGMGVNHWIPKQQPGILDAKRWYDSFYFKEKQFSVGNGWTVVVEASMRPQLEDISRQTIVFLAGIAFLILAFIALSQLLAARYSLTIQKLENVTRRLPMWHSGGESIIWPTPMSKEMAGLVDNFKMMADAIQKHLTELKGLNEALEQRVLERTRELQESERFTLDVLNSLSANVAVLDSNGVIIAANEPWHNFVHQNCPPLGTHASGKIDYLSLLTDCIVKDDTEATAAFNGIAAVLRGDTHKFSLEHASQSQGKKNWLVMNVSRLNGPRCGVVVSHSDISQRKEAEEKLLEAMRFNEQIICSAQEGVIVFDMDLRYRIWNPFMERISGKTSGEVLGKHPTEIFPLVVKSGVLACLEKVVAGEASAAIDMQAHDPKTGKPKWFANLIVPLLNSKGEKVGVISTVREITYRKQMESDLRQALEAAKSANSTMSRLLHVVAHEFRTPLGLLTGCTDILDRYWDRLTIEKRFEQNEHIRSAARQISNLVDSVTSFNQLGSFGDHRVVLDISAICRSIASEVETAKGAGHGYAVSIAEDCGSAFLDEILFRRVLENLLSNAFRYTPSDGTVALHVCREKDRLQVAVTDTGIGIPEEDQALVFEAFYRSRNVEGRRGLGLGLSIVHESLSQMGGTITVTSTVGKGTTMRVEIPVVNPV